MINLKYIRIKAVNVIFVTLTFIVCFTMDAMSAGHGRAAHSRITHGNSFKKGSTTMPAMAKPSNKTESAENHLLTPIFAAAVLTGRPSTKAENTDNSPDISKPIRDSKSHIFILLVATVASLLLYSGTPKGRIVFTSLILVFVSIVLKLFPI